MIRHQWMTYQNEDTPDSYFRLEENNKSTSGRIQYSYLEHALEFCHLTTNTTSVYIFFSIIMRHITIQAT